MMAAPRARWLSCQGPKGSPLNRRDKHWLVFAREDLTLNGVVEMRLNLHHLIDSFVIGLLGMVVAVTVCGCASTATTVRLREDRDSCTCDLQNDSLGSLIDAALVDPEDSHAMHALAHFVERWHRTAPHRENEIVEGGEYRYRVSFGGSHGPYPLQYFDEITPALDFKVKKLQHHRKPGVGAPLVALRENRKREPIESYYPPEAITRPITAVIHKGALRGGVQDLRIELICPLGSRQIMLDGEKRELAVDFSVPWAALIERAASLKRSQLLDFASTRQRREPKLYLMEPYDPNKEPLIMIHGLLGSPLVWAELSNALWDDDDIRARYQIWHFLYDTSAPALYAGRLLREQMLAVRKLLDPSGRDPAMQSTTVIAHSMGAIVTRSLLTRPKNAFWDAAFTQSFDSLKLSDSDRDALREAFFWESTPHVKRVIYIAASHRGSDFADNPIGRIGRLFAKPPKDGFQKFYERISTANPGAFTEAYRELGSGELDSIHALSPSQPTLAILAGLPNNHAVREYSIIGNDGKPGPIEKSSDGIVEYWSSHIDRAESERIVPADHHGALEHPESLAEVKRILMLP